MNKVIRWSTLPLGLSMVLLVACATQPTVETYHFDDPGSGKDAVENRLESIHSTLKTCRNAEVCKQYALEAGLIYNLIENQDIESEKYFRKALAYSPEDCDARLLLASNIGQRKNNKEMALESLALLSGGLDNCGGTVVEYHNAKLKIFSDDPAEISAGRQRLDGLAELRLGNSGVSKSDVYNLILFSYLSEGDFDSAYDELGGFDSVDVRPSLAALTMIGKRGGDTLAGMEGEAASSAKMFLLERAENYTSASELAGLAGEVDHIEIVEAIPWQDIEKKLNDDPALSSTQRAIQEAAIKDRYKSLEYQLERRDRAMEEVAVYAKHLEEAEKAVLTQTIDDVFSGEISDSLEEKKQKYMQQSRRLVSSMDELVDVHTAIARIPDLEMLTLQTEDGAAEAEKIVNFVEMRSKINLENADQILLSNFVINVCRDMEPGDYFEPYQIMLDQLSFETADVVKNVEKLADLAGVNLPGNN